MFFNVILPSVMVAWLIVVAIYFQLRAQEYKEWYEEQADLAEQKIKEVIDLHNKLKVSQEEVLSWQQNNRSLEKRAQILQADVERLLAEKESAKSAVLTLDKERFDLQAAMNKIIGIVDAFKLKKVIEPASDKGT